MKTTNECRQKILAHKVLVITCLAAVFGLTGCEQEGTAEKAGAKIDRAAENAEQKIDQVKDQAEKEIEAAKESVADKTQTAEEYVDDSVITAQVKAAILNDPLLNASHIEVTTVKGVVKLSGTVDSEQSIGRAMEVVSSQKHVKSVENNLVVNVLPDKI
ncbi:MAG: BON domain-containing protein [Methylobacter sp.]|nr:BON domain-containing protein [Methylobacter sp.]